MADFSIAYNWMMDNEDKARQCKTVPDAPGEWGADENGHKVWNGAHVISGINSAAYPKEFAQIDALLLKQRPAAVQSFYQTQFWNRWFDQLVSDEVSKRVFDASVNMGPGTAVKVAQEAVNEGIGNQLVAEDGGWGPNTLAAINRCEESSLVSSLRNARLSYYKRIVAKHPEDAKYLGTEQNPGPWWIRAVQ